MRRAGGNKHGARAGRGRVSTAMHEIRCPVCGEVTSFPDVFIAGPCPACGYDLLRRPDFVDRRGVVYSGYGSHY